MVNNYKLHCPECNSEEISTITDKNKTVFVCDSCGHKFVKKRVFISYGRDEYAHFAENLKQQLLLQNCEVWFDQDKIREGIDWEGYIEDGLNWVAEAGENGIMLFVVTPHSVRRPDGFCLKEMAKAVIKKIAIFPIMLIYSELPLSICNLQWYDMQDCIPVDERYNNFIKKSEQLISLLSNKQIQTDSMQFLLYSILDPIDYSDDIIAKTRKFTGREWLINKFDQWLKISTNKNRIFWLTGAPGVGKSSIAAWIAENRHEIGAIHFCGFKNEQKNNPIRIIKSITYQLSTQLPEYTRVLMEYKVNEVLKTYNDTTTLFNKLIVQPLNKVPAPDRIIVIVIDAIDEASKNGRNEVASFIADEFDKTPPWLKLFITSRPDPEVMLPLQKLSPFTIDTSCDENYDDIKRYLQVELLPFLKDVQLSNKDEYVNKLAKKSEGVFQYVKCICNELTNEGLGIADIDKFPKSLGSIYLNSFERQFKNIDFYQKNVKDIISVIICAKEPITTDLLKKIFKISDTDFYNLLVLMGSIFEVRGSSDNETIKIQHLSYTDWLVKREKSGHYYVSISDGLHKLEEYGLMEYDAFLADASYDIDNHIIKWLPTYLADLNNYPKLASLLNNRQYINKKIALGYKDILFNDLSIQLRLAKTNNDCNYHKILANTIYAHDSIVSIFTDNLINLTKKGDYPSLKQAIENTEQLVGKELLIAYISILYSSLFLKKLDEAQKNEIANDILGKIGNNIIARFNPINCLDFFPLNFINAICYQIENINIPCGNILSICKFKITINDNYGNRWDANESYSFILTNLAFDFYSKNKLEKAIEIINRLDHKSIERFKNRIRKEKGKAAILDANLSKKRNDSQSGFRKTIGELFVTFSSFIMRLVLTIILPGLRYTHISLHFIFFRSINLVNRFLKISQDDTKAFFKLLINVSNFSWKILRFYNLQISEKTFFFKIYKKVDRLKAKILKARVIKTIKQKNDCNKSLTYSIDLLKSSGIRKNIIGTLDISSSEYNGFKNSNSYNILKLSFISCFVEKNLLEVVPIELLFFHSNQHDFSKILALGEIAFISKKPSKILNFQKKLAIRFDKYWVKTILNDWSIYSMHEHVDWQLINPNLASGEVFDGKDLKSSYKNLLFFIDNYEGVVSLTPELYFPELAGIECSYYENTDTIKSKSDKIIKNIEDVCFYNSLLRKINHLDVEDINSKNFENKMGYWGIIGLIHYHFEYLNNGQNEKSDMFFKKTIHYIQGYSKDGDELFVKLFTEIYINEKIGVACNLILNHDKEAEFYCDILLLQYLTHKNQDLIGYFVNGQIEKNRGWKVICAICWLNESGLIKISEKIVNKLPDGVLKDDLLGYIAYHYIKANEREMARTYLDRINNDTKKDDWLQAAAILSSREKDYDMVDYCLERICFIDNKAITLCMVAEEFAVNNENEALDKISRYQIEAYKIGLTLKKNIEVKQLVLKYIFVQNKLPDTILFEAFETLIREKLLDAKEKYDFLHIVVEKLIDKGDLYRIENLYNRHPEFIREAGGIGLLYRHGYTFNKNNQIASVKRHYDIFRNIESIENNLCEFTAENIHNKEVLIDTAYRYAAYTSLIRKGDKKHRTEILNELNEVIDVNDWAKKI